MENNAFICILYHFVSILRLLFNEVRYMFSTEPTSYLSGHMWRCGDTATKMAMQRKTQLGAARGEIYASKWQEKGGCGDWPSSKAA